MIHPAHVVQHGRDQVRLGSLRLLDPIDGAAVDAKRPPEGVDALVVLRPLRLLLLRASLLVLVLGLDLLVLRRSRLVRHGQRRGIDGRPAALRLRRVEPLLLLLVRRRRGGREGAIGEEAHGPTPSTGVARHISRRLRGRVGGGRGGHSVSPPEGVHRLPIPSRLVVQDAAVVALGDEGGRGAPCSLVRHRRPAGVVRRHAGMGRTLGHHVDVGGVGGHRGRRRRRLRVAVVLLVGGEVGVMIGNG
mmetsp:Transcript_13599/g.25483  ORF Transcript_13599/g.25483 Transcript_13599/m.25483 type:complete len:246 (-) Transcript_13599:476-1213(-)